MFHYPNDQTPLVRHEQRGGVFWACDACGGRTATIAMLRRAAQQEIAEMIWSLARASKSESQRHCPACERPMKSVSLPAGGSLLELDVCTNCYFAWFDPAEFESLPGAAAAPARTSSDTALPLEARLALARSPRLNRPGCGTWSRSTQSGRSTKGGPSYIDSSADGPYMPGTGISFSRK